LNRRAEILEVKKGTNTMKNNYEIPEVVEIDEAHNIILGTKEFGTPDYLNGDENTRSIDPSTDIDE
jgi:hypothetical protein